MRSTKAKPHPRLVAEFTIHTFDDDGKLLKSATCKPEESIIVHNYPDGRIKTEPFRRSKLRLRRGAPAPIHFERQQATVMKEQSIRELRTTHERTAADAVQAHDYNGWLTEISAVQVLDLVLQDYDAPLARTRIPWDSSPTD